MFFFTRAIVKLFCLPNTENLFRALKTQQNLSFLILYRFDYKNEYETLPQKCLVLYKSAVDYKSAVVVVLAQQLF